MATKPDLDKFMNDPEFKGDRDILNAAVDARLKHHADEAEKKRRENPEQPWSLFDVFNLFK